MLSEDSGSHVHATWTALLRRMCRIVDGSCDTQPEVFTVEAPEVGAASVMHGNGWRERPTKPDHHRRLVGFWRTLAEQLEGEHVVVFHVDGDVPWSRRGESGNVRDVAGLAERRLRDVLEDLGRTPEAVERRMSFFVPVHPFREVEAWLFHNTEVLREIFATRRMAVPPCVERWEERPAALDEEEQPKKAMPFGAEHNEDLTERFPAERVYELGSSFFAAVEALERCAPLREALRRTYAAERWQTE